MQLIKVWFYQFSRILENFFPFSRFLYSRESKKVEKFSITTDYFYVSQVKIILMFLCMYLCTYYTFLNWAADSYGLIRLITSQRVLHMYVFIQDFLSRTLVSTIGHAWAKFLTIIVTGAKSNAILQGASRTVPASSWIRTGAGRWCCRRRRLTLPFSSTVRKRIPSYN